ncbi:MAG: NAD+ synthase [Desulfurococcaceae archaeon]
MSVDQLISLDFAGIANDIISALEAYAREAGRRTYVMGLSGGVDSSVTAALLTRAVGPENVVALIMPDSRVNSDEEVSMAVSLARELGIGHRVVFIDKIVDSFKDVLGDWGEGLAIGNVRARIRMAVLYYFANKLQGLVAGTSDKSELLIGYFTKYGDGAADILPIGSLYKTQVRALGRYLGLPRDIVEKPSSPGLWPGHTAEGELGISYEEIDLVLYAFFDLGMGREEVLKFTGLRAEVVDKVMGMVKSSEHKRALPRLVRPRGLKPPY